MVLSHETVNAYKELLTNPQKHGLQFKPLHECFEEIEEVTPKHLLFEDNVEALTSVRNDSVRFLSMSFSNMDVVKKYMSS